MFASEAVGLFGGAGFSHHVNGLHVVAIDSAWGGTASTKGFHFLASDITGL